MIRYGMNGKDKEEVENRDVNRRKIPETAKDIYDVLAHGGRVGYDVPISIVRRLANSEYPGICGIKI